MIEWQNNPPEKPMNWNEAIEYAESLGDGWRLPTRAELIDAYDNNVGGFDFSYYWSSRYYVRDYTYAWLVDCDLGSVSVDFKTSGGFVRCVREMKGE